MKLRKIVKWSGSQTGNCPAIYAADNGDLVVQGWTLDAETRAELHDVLPGEGAVRIPAGLLADYPRQRNGAAG